MKIIINESQLNRIFQKDIDEIKTTHKKIFGEGMDREVYLSHTNPHLVIKLWVYEDLIKEKELFDKHPDLFVKIYKVRPYENPKYDNVGYAVMERLNTKAFKEEVNRLMNALESIGYHMGVFRFIDISRNEDKYERFVDELNDIDPSISDFFINLRDCVIGVESTVRFFDRSFNQFGLDNDGNVKCFDV